MLQTGMPSIWLPPQAIPITGGYFIPSTAVQPGQPANVNQTELQPVTPTMPPATPPVQPTLQQLPTTSPVTPEQSAAPAAATLNLPFTYALPEFAGNADENLEDFMRRFEIAAKCYRWTDSDKLDVLKASLKGNAASFMRAYNHLSLEDYLKQLNTSFGTAAYENAYLSQLTHYKRAPGESVLQVQMNIKRLCEAVFPNDIGCEMYTERLIDYFVAALNANALATEIYRHGPEALEAASKLAHRTETMMLQRKLPRSAQSADTNPSPAIVLLTPREPVVKPVPAQAVLVV
jgi:hypothetical protein